jgi:hypothetical protein
MFLGIGGIGGIVGGVPMIVNSLWYTRSLIPLSLLQYSPFHSYLIPGIILQVSNGLLPLWVYSRVKRSQLLGGLWTAFQGCVLFGFMTGKCIMLRVMAWPHLFYYAALALIVLGFLLNSRPAPEPAHG